MAAMSEAVKAEEWSLCLTAAEAEALFQFTKQSFYDAENYFVQPEANDAVRRVHQRIYNRILGPIKWRDQQ